MDNVAKLKEQILIELRLGLLRCRRLRGHVELLELSQVLEESVRCQLDELIEEAIGAGFEQGQNNVFEAFNAPL